MKLRVTGLVLLVVGISGCGGSGALPAAKDAESSGEPAPSPKQADASDDSVKNSDAPTHEKIPTTCAKGSDPCTPPGAFVNKLCAGSFPGVALYLFTKNTPYARQYLTRKTEAWNASGGVSEAASSNLMKRCWCSAQERPILVACRSAAQVAATMPCAGAEPA